MATAFGAIAPIGWDLAGVMAGTGCLRFLLQRLPRWGDRRRADRAVLRLVVQPYTFPVSMLSRLISARAITTTFSVCGGVAKPASGPGSKKKNAGAEITCLTQLAQGGE